MTTNELIEKLKGLGFTVKESEGYIHIETGNTDMHYSKNISPNDDWAKVLPLIAEYYQTPLDERKPEKKYRLRWIDGEDDNPRKETYLGMDDTFFNGSYWTTYFKSGAPTFTESQLEKLKRDNPRFAPAIDVMKEEVKDDD
jgi:hypothetical protein